MRIGHYQCICREHDFERNLETLRKGLRLAADANLDILSFPESSLTGYYRDGEMARVNSFSVESPEFKSAISITRDYESMVLVGFNELRGEKLFNSMAVIDRGTLLGTYSKAFPIFDYFEPGRDFPVFRKDELIFGIIICADSSYIEPARILALKGARLIFSPHNNLVNDPLDHALHVRASHTARAVENRVFMLRGNNVYDREDYGRLINHVPHYGYGDSFLLDPQAQCYAGAGMHAETLMIANIDFARYERPAWEVSQSRRSAEALLDTLKDTL